MNDEFINAISKSPDPSASIASDRRIRDLDRQREDAIAKYEALAKSYEVLEKRLELLTDLSDRPPAEQWSAPSRPRHSDSHATAIIMLSDWHVEQLILPERVSGLNEYNLDIAEQRIRRTFDKAILLLDDARNLTNISEVVVWLGGDFIHGRIHDEYNCTNTLHPFKACRWAADRIESGLRQIAAHPGVERLRIYTNHGNHGRNTKKMTNATAAEESFEYNMYCDIRRRMSDIGEWNIADGYFNYAEIQGKQIRFHHGQRISFGGGINGVGVPAWRFISKANSKIRADIDIFGHFHTFGCPGTAYISNGSLNGVDEYSETFEGDPEPKQGFVVLDRRYGLTRAIPIFCR